MKIKGTIYRYYGKASNLDDFLDKLGGRLIGDNERIEIYIRCKATKPAPGHDPSERGYKFGRQKRIRIREGEKLGYYKGYERTGGQNKTIMTRWMPLHGFNFAYLKEKDLYRISDECKNYVHEQLRGDANALISYSNWIGKWIIETYQEQLDTRDWKDGPKSNDEDWYRIKGRMLGWNEPAGSFTGQLFESMEYGIKLLKRKGF